MWEYRWAEVPAGSGADPELSALGAEGWESVSMAVTGEHFGRTWVRILFKRPVRVPATPGVIDLTEAATRTT